jgi:uncharacterized SAM-binding protein YcdF (DUF218 family)
VRALALVVLVYLVSLACVVLIAARDERRPVDAIVVLGAAEYNGRPSPVLRARLDHALTLYRLHLAPVLLVTGGVADRERVSEAQTAQRYLVGLGVPSDSVVTEPGRSTATSMDAVAEYLQARHTIRVLLVSDPFHLARVHLEAWRLGLEAYTSPTRTSPISRNFRAELGYLLAEAAKLPVIFIKGLLS